MELRGKDGIVRVITEKKIKELFRVLKKIVRRAVFYNEKLGEE
jgi:hypothetical protein